MIDTHSHLNLDPLVENNKQQHQTAKKSGVEKIVVPGVNYQSSEKAVEIAGELEGVFAAIGLHPHEAEHLLTTQKTQDIYHWLVEWGSKQKVVAVGECGLDYFRLPKDSLQSKHIKAFQKKLFKLHIKASREVGKPLLVHVRDAQEDAIELLENYSPLPKITDQTRFVLHCFSGDKKYLNRALKIGGYISFAGNVTFKNAKELVEVLRVVPIDRLLLETDAPFLNPNRGSWPNTSANIIKTYQYVAETLDLTIDNLVKQIENNCKQILEI